MAHGRRIAVIGLGYVGLPVSVAFARAGVPTIGFDISTERVDELRAGRDRTGETAASELALPRLAFTADEREIGKADFFVVTVPTPIDHSNHPDLSPLIAASRSVGRHLKPGDIVVY